MSEKMYQGTEIDVIPTSISSDPVERYGIGIIDVVAGGRFGRYANCGYVHTEEK